MPPKEPWSIYKKQMGPYGDGDALWCPTPSTDERINLIKSIFSNPDEVVALEYISRDDAQAFVDLIDEALENLDSLPPEIRRRCLHSLCRTCGNEALVPKSLLIPLCYNPMDDPLFPGGFGDVWKGKYKGQEVAAKVLRTYITSDFEKIRKRFCEEVIIWKTLRHPNVLPLLGAMMTESPYRLGMVSEWMENGNINQFLQRVDADRLKLLEDVTKGLIYMHDLGVVHGDLKGANIYINETGHAVLADFGLTTLIPDQSIPSSTYIEGGTTPWMSPELIDPETFGLQSSRPTMESDCYALGMVVYEVLSGQTPFAPYKNPIFRILRGDRPKKPQGAQGARFTDDIWNAVEHCWKAKPSERITAKDVLQMIRRAKVLAHKTAR